MMRHELRNYAAIDHLLGLAPGMAQAVGLETEEVFPEPAKRTFYVDRPGDYASAWSSAIHYQRYLYALIRLAKPAVIVETGVDWGVSTRMILAAVARYGGRLESVDPSYANQEQAELAIESRLGSINVRNWRFHSDVSTDALPRIAKDCPVWDLFLHDGDHGAFAQSFDYSFAWLHLRPGGFLVSDDYVWGRPAHCAWEMFCQREGFKHYYTIGNAAVVRKPFLADGKQPPAFGVRGPLTWASCMAYADAAERNYDTIPGAADNRYPRTKAR